jgi:AraC-like DNA-binding protein
VKRGIQEVVFGLILKGRGRLRYGKRWFAVKSPCVLTVWPGVYEEYGPEPEGATWEELYIAYDPKLTPLFETWGIHPAQNPVWPIASDHTVRQLVDELIDCMQSREARGMVDRIDRLCHRLLLESLLEQPPPPETPHDATLDQIRINIAKDLGQPHDSHQVAREYGMAEVTFRRHWKQRFGTPFKHDLINMRMQEACRLLVNTNRDIKTIATVLGFKDAHYFSHRFTKLIGMTATEYRQQFNEHR